MRCSTESFKIVYNRRLNVTDLTEFLDLTQTMTSAKAISTDNHRKKWTSHESQSALRLHNEGQSYAQIAKRLQRTEKAIRVFQ